MSRRLTMPSKSPVKRSSTSARSLVGAAGFARSRALPERLAASTDSARPSATRDSSAAELFSHGTFTRRIATSTAPRGPHALATQHSTIYQLSAPGAVTPTSAISRRPRRRPPTDTRILPTACGAPAHCPSIAGAASSDTRCVTSARGSTVPRFEQRDHGRQLVGRIARPEDRHFLQHDEPGLERHVAFEPPDAADASARRDQVQREPVGRRRSDRLDHDRRAVAVGERVHLLRRRRARPSTTADGAQATGLRELLRRRGPGR